MTVMEEMKNLVEAYETGLLVIFKREIDEVIKKIGGDVNPLDVYIKIAAKIQELYETLYAASDVKTTSFNLCNAIANYTREYEGAAVAYFHSLVDEISRDANSFYGMIDATKKLEAYKKILDSVGASYIYDDCYTSGEDEKTQASK